MKGFLIGIFAPVLTGLLSSEPVSSQVQIANEWFEAMIFDKAAPVYEEILHKKHSELPSHVEEALRIRLGYSHYSQGSYAECLAFVTDPFTDSELQRQAHYLSGLTYKQLHAIDASLRAFNLVQNMPGAPNDMIQQLTHYETGCLLYDLKEWNQAQKNFETIANHPLLLHTFSLAQMYCARIELLKGKPQHSCKRLNELKGLLTKDDPLLIEIAYIEGEALYAQKNYIEAAKQFERAMLQHIASDAPWQVEALFKLAWCFAKMGEENSIEQTIKEAHFIKAEELLQSLIKSQSEEKNIVALGQLYLTKAHHLNDKQSLRMVEKTLGPPQVFSIPFYRAHALYLRAAAAPEIAYVLYDELTQPDLKQTPFYAEAWYLKGKHEYETGVALMASGQKKQGCDALSKAASSFHLAYGAWEEANSPLSLQALFRQAQSWGLQKTPEASRCAANLLDALIGTNRLDLGVIEDPGEVHYLRGLMAVEIAKWTEDDPGTEEAERHFKQVIEKYPTSPLAPQSLLALGGVYYHKKKYAMGEDVFMRLIRTFPESDAVGDAYFWAAKCGDGIAIGSEKGKKYRRIVFEEFPNNPLAAEAYFTYHPYREYVHGDRAAIKHLQNLSERFPHTPYLINAHYLVGMDFKRDRKTAEGKWVRKKNMNEASVAFQQSATAFDSLYAAKNIPEDQLQYFITIRYRALIERALANLAIADEAQGARRQIFLEYAVAVLEQIATEFKDRSHPLASQLTREENYPPALEESTYWLAQAYSRMQEDQKAEKTLVQMLENYPLNKITRGYYMSRAWHDLGQIAIRRKEYPIALVHFAEAEKAAKGNAISTDQKIDLWIQQSLCYKEMKQPEKAMLILSKAINDDAISSLRVKAMFLRAEIYALQGRHELAKRQLEATSKKGGEWALKAKLQLEKEYGT